MKMTKTRGTLLVSLILLTIICASVIFLYFPLTNNWFTSDATYLIWASASLKLHEMFFSPERHRVLSSNFNPMYGLTFKIDWLLFQMNASGYAVHSILSMLAVSIALYFFLRLYTGKQTALLGVLFFLLHPITIHMTGLLFRKHYIEGLFCALLSLYFFVRSDREGKASIPSSFFYLIASLYREVYVVLPAIAFLISNQSSISKRIRNTLPLWAGLLIYTTWRLWIREGLGGYPSNQPLFSIETLLFIPNIISSLSLQWSHDYQIFIYALLSILFFSSLKYPRVFFCFLILLVPILPVSNIITGDLSAAKYFFHLTVFLIIGIILLIEKPPIKYRLLFRGFLLSLCFFYMLISIKQDVRLVNAMIEEGKEAKNSAMEFLYSGKPYIKAHQDSWFYTGLKNLQKDFYGRDIQTQIVPPDDFLRYSDPEKLLAMEHAGIDIPYAEIVNIQKKFQEGPITVKLSVNDYKLAWDFGPFKDKTYTMLRSSVSGLYYNKSDLRSSGTYMLPKAGQDQSPEIVYLRIFYISEDGRTVITPEFTLRIPSDQTIEYHKSQQP